jgi:hypothetical protein
MVIRNEKGLVFEVDRGIDKENAIIYVGEEKPKELKQQFKIVYADEMPDEPKKGDMVEEWGLKANVPFYLQSTLPSGRYLDLPYGTRNLAIKTFNGRNSQKWYFDYASRTIKSVQTRGWSWDIQNAGRSTNM